MGYEFTEQELDRAMQEALVDSELSEEELEAVAGAAKKKVVTDPEGDVIKAVYKR